MTKPSAPTPGPWRYDPRRRSILAPSKAREADGEPKYWRDIAQIDRTTSANVPDVEADANGYRMAASLAMYEALRHLVLLLEPLEQDGRLDVPGLATLNRQRAALARARVEGDDDAE